jgi:hypothetical protein
MALVHVHCPQCQSMAVYLHPAAKYSRLTRRLSQEQKVL